MYNRLYIIISKDSRRESFIPRVFACLKKRDFIWIYIYIVLIKFDPRENGKTISLRSAFRWGRRNRKWKDGWCLSVIVTSAFHGNEPRFTEATVPLIERPAPPGSRPFPNKTVPLLTYRPSSSPFPFVSRPFHLFDHPISLCLSVFLSLSSRILFRDRENGFDELSIISFPLSGWRDEEGRIGNNFV